MLILVLPISVDVTYTSYLLYLIFFPFGHSAAKCGRGINSYAPYWGIIGCLWVAHEFLSSLRELRNASAATKERRKEEENGKGGKDGV